ncbi:MAG: hypothetical protein OXU20_23140 [Myxococcales bacterium]|nr:hypothetical protein [Myxococcales bacterium]
MKTPYVLILLPAAGLAAFAAMGPQDASHDRLEFALTLVMAIALCAGLFELAKTLRRTLAALETLSGRVATRLDQGRNDLPTATQTLREIASQLDALRSDQKGASVRSGDQLEALRVELREAQTQGGAHNADVQKALQDGLADAQEQQSEGLELTAGRITAALETGLARVASSMRDDMPRAAAEIAAATTAQFQPLVERAIDRHGELGAQHLQAVAQMLADQRSESQAHHQESLTRFEQHARTLLDAQANLSQAAQKGWDSSARAVTEQLERGATQLSELAAYGERLTRAEANMLSQHEQCVARTSDLLASHTLKLDERLQANDRLMEQAAGLVQAGGSELVTVAETFAAAVEHQRHAAQQWLESLGEIERSVSEAGEAAAADVLGQHLARTHEVFERQLRFQQELIAQLQRDGRKRHSDEAKLDA